MFKVAIVGHSQVPCRFDGEKDSIENKEIMNAMLVEKD